MRFTLKNHVHLEGWAAADIRFNNFNKEEAAVLLAVKTDTRADDGREEAGRELFEIEVRKKEVRFIPNVRKGTHLFIDGRLRMVEVPGNRRELIVTAIRIHSIDWEGYKAEGLKAMQIGLSTDQDELIERWSRSVLENRR